jgi:uncharacterized membrane protein YhhN
MFVYILFLAVVIWTAFMTGNRWIIIATLFFLMSDKIRAFSLFVSSGGYFDFLIILSYFGAQFLIAHSIGTLTSKREKPIPCEAHQE